MSLTHTIKYLYYSIRYPNLGDYLDMGFGISARYSRASKYWAQHLHLCKEMNREALQGSQHGSLDGSNKDTCLTILGAGRLLDVDVEFIKRGGFKVRMIDADPSVRSVWKAKFPNLTKPQALTMDLTQCIEDWSTRLKDFIKKSSNEKENAEDSAAELVSFLYSLKPGQGHDLKIGDRSQIIFSQNILGQLGIYWRDRAYDLITKEIKPNSALVESSGELLPNIKKALAHTIKLLELQHLGLLINSKADTILILTDCLYHYYEKNNSNWQTDPALELGGYSELKKVFNDSCYELTTDKSWLWHIAPQGIEDKEHGSIHEVVALILKKREAH